ncbi:PP2C family protein-serine/threonine phosphatase [Litchfieldia salsa]|uniref:GAF domain-containing protein n=1 Tax=Litchfieldia salsa TaxID=930152 RepID=A0A1H0USL5_9BACI|nr:GAF domain-containing SpoIIE family protein phosphatase [Litchfieldia salsa]SDP69182.1 GAF domain-containing protein [Litchfieldia salsa]
MKNIQRKFEEAAHNVLSLMNETVEARSFFISSTTQNRFKILNTINNEGGCTIPDKVDEPLDLSYCGYVTNEKKPLLITDALQNSLVRELQITQTVSIRSYLGVPIVLEDGSVFGTLCALDPDPNVLSEADIPKLLIYASLIANTIELEETVVRIKNNEIQAKKELQLASKIQLATLDNVPKDPNLEVDYLYKPSAMLSGDLYAWNQIEEGVYGAVVLDVMGHGVSSALIGMAIYPQLKDLIQQEKEPYKVMKKINGLLISLFQHEDFYIYVTGIYVYLDLNKGEIQYLNAGHPPGIIITDKDEKRDFLKDGTVPLGILKDLPCNTGVVHFSQDATLILFTDGLTDHFRKNGKVSARDILSRLIDNSLKATSSFTAYIEEQLDGKEDLEDDVCVLSFKLKQIER